MSAQTSHKSAAKKDKSAAKKSFWSIEIGKKGANDEHVEHPTFIPSLPRVDLLPGAVRQSIALHNVIRWFAVVLAVVVLAGAALWWLQGSRIDDASQALAQAQSEQQAIDKQMAALAPVKEMYTQIRGQQELVNSTLAAQPKATEVLVHLYDVARQSTGPKGIQFSSASVTYSGLPKPGAQPNLCPNPHPFSNVVTVGCMTFDGTAIDRAHIADFLAAMGADPMFVGPFVDSSTTTVGDKGQDGRVAFAGTSGISVDALQQPLTPEQLKALTDPQAADATANGSPS